MTVRLPLSSFELAAFGSNIPAIIDFEASCLPEDAASYPIEVALTRLDGRSYSRLIQPLPAWRYWDWSDEAEQLHGITQLTLQQHGTPAAAVIRELAEATKDCTVYADCDLDAYWLETLCAGVGAPLPFPIVYLGELLASMHVTRHVVVAALERAKREAPEEHIARHDANRLALALSYIFEAQAESVAMSDQNFQ